MIVQEGEITDIGNRGEDIIISTGPSTVGQSILLHPGPVKLIQDGDQQKLNRSMYVALKTIKDAYTSGVTPEDVRNLMKLAHDTITAIEQDKDLMEQIK